MIRQAISCDICGTEKKQTNHWFVAYDQAGELRVSGWSSRNRLRPGSKHLCGQTCLHKLVDDFMARALTVRAPRASQIELEDEELVERATTNDTSLTSDGAYKEIESSARLIAAPKPVAPPVAQSTPPVVTTVAPASAPARPQLIMPIELVAALPARQRLDELPVPASEPPRYASRNWRAAAWERERERELRSGERYAGLASRRRFSS